MLIAVSLPGWHSLENVSRVAAALEALGIVLLAIVALAGVARLISDNRKIQKIAEIIAEVFFVAASGF